MIILYTFIPSIFLNVVQLININCIQFRLAVVSFSFSLFLRINTQAERRSWFFLPPSQVFKEGRKARKHAQRLRGRLRGGGRNQNANRRPRTRCKSIEIGCKGLNITLRDRGSLKSITADYRGKVTPLPPGLRQRAVCSLNKTRGGRVSRAFCKYCYRHPAGNFASHMSEHGCLFHRFRLPFLPLRSTSPRSTSARGFHAQIQWARHQDFLLPRSVPGKSRSSRSMLIVLVV